MTAQVYSFFQTYNYALDTRNPQKRTSSFTRKTKKIDQNTKLRVFSFQMRNDAAKFHQMKADRLNFPRDSYYMYLNMHQIYGKQMKNKVQIKVDFICVYI